MYMRYDLNVIWQWTLRLAIKYYYRIYIIGGFIILLHFSCDSEDPAVGTGYTIIGEVCKISLNNIRYFP